MGRGAGSGGSDERPRLLPVLGDQLSPDLASLKGGDQRRDVVLMAEVAEEATYARHHKQKLAFFFSAMRHFADELRGAGWRVDYVRLDAAGNTGSLRGEVCRAAERHDVRAVVLTEPGEWRLWEEMCGWDSWLGLPVSILPDRRFFLTREEFFGWAGDKAQLRMEPFYRWMRTRTGLLMEGGRPAGGRWNFDRDNRQWAPPDLFMPDRHAPAPDATTREVMRLVEARFPKNFGRLDGFAWAVTREEAEAALDHFIDHGLPRFGALQDAMVRGAPFVHHSLLSAAMNVGLLDPREVCRRVEAAWWAGHAPLNSAEGFIRQVIGWREFVRGVYWLDMPGYRDQNFLGATRPLPRFYWWPEETDLACLHDALSNTEAHAYAHHIQRLMVTGNFAMLAGVDPVDVHEWYLAVYADAVEWVELPNTLGMSQFGDGGRLSTKPYAASGTYLSRMSDYCEACPYDVKKRVGADACPLNALYWDFFARNGEKLRGVPRVEPVYRALDRMGAAERGAIRTQAARFLEGLNSPAVDLSEMRKG